MFLIVALILIFIPFLTTVSAFFSFYKQFQMLQQNSYYPSRYFKWLKENYVPQLALLAIVWCLIASLKFSPLVFPLAISVVLLVVRIILFARCKKKSIKKLVFTNRVKRLYAVATVIFIALICLLFFGKDMVSEISFVLLTMFSVVSPLTVFVIWAVTYPIEKAVSRWYVNDAKKILREHKNLTVIGITGSYGKTTTKFILNRILSEKYNTVCTPQSFNTPMGVVRTVRESIKPNTQIFICEMGAKNIGDIKEICDIAHPKYGIITSVGKQHLETFKTEDNVFKTKFELADEVSKNGGVCFVNLDSDGINARITQRNDVVTFGDNTDYKAENMKFGADGSTFDLVLKGEKITVTTKLLGKHSVSDILAACTVAHILGVSPDDIRFAVGSLKATEHRLELKPFKNGSLLIDDAYNSNPEGCLEAVKVLSSFGGMKKVIITPGLIELGEREYESNYELGLAAAKYCDIIILVGKNRSKPMRDAISTTDFDKNNVYVVSSFKEGMEIYLPLADKNSVLLIENDLPDNYLN
ncbi:MAG: UDP-N-acetylmuramoyl-tripeptide--D-alanyl-D-alanine ligase [Clostridia bacterium]|nr:UDP-N-acetylmuramoyl-tripeptide--D-alanyl-D-alanine ligase [Clostridia bacterium]